ncbi:hypothetical protein J2Z42_002226 [Clostridium algifaecis]|uniref:Rod shape-determining protein MreD n=1 Tax=Clostridium algifaecis TaxID=1472040 RepID=A0ABS4KTY5_9CLOT|nr:hypothetical protein [Clostridium algifaecis]MBP2033523.1 hypothetical protein [Clostridium algifaecis]
MIKISLLDVLLRGIPEAFLFVFASYLFCNKKFDEKYIILSTIIFDIGIYCIRILPIQFGVHIILNTILYVFISVKINKISYMQSIQYCIILQVILSLSETVNLFILNSISTYDSHTLLNSSILKNICFLPSIVMFLLGILICYKFLYKKNNVGSNFLSK